MNNQSNKPEKLEPRDSEQKGQIPAKEDNKAVVKNEDKIYRRREADFKDPAKYRETIEQPVHPIKNEPK